MKLFDISKLSIKPLSERKSKSNLSVLIDPHSTPTEPPFGTLSKLERIAQSVRKSKENNSPVVFAFGAHLIKNGLSRVLIELMRQGYVQHILANEAVVIHDWEFSFLGRTEEDVEKYVAEGQFGLWEETGVYLNRAIKSGAENNIGYGEAVGKMIYTQEIDGAEVIHRNWDISVLAMAYALDIPVSIGVSIGQNIHHTNPECSGEALGKVGYIDFLKLADTISNLEGGVYISIGSAITSPMIFEKALSMGKNLAKQKNRKLENYSIFVNDIQPGSWDWSKGEPPKDNPAYYLRFMKTFSRMGGTSEYIQMDNRTFLHNLYHLLK